LTDKSALLIADASAVINLNASGYAKEIVQALPNRVAVVDVVLEELRLGRARGRRDADLLNELIAADLVERVSLDPESEAYFEQLVIGPATLTLDDGEAATIAYAVSHKAVAIIDEAKATKICRERFPRLELASTVDIFAHQQVFLDIGSVLLSEVVFNALSRGRMRVFTDRISWVVELIGADRAAQCPSLPRSVRAMSVTSTPPCRNRS